MAKSPRPADVSPGRDTSTQDQALTRGENRDRIAQRAFERYESRGREDGRDQEDWFEAEREFEQGPSGSTTAGGRDGDRGGSGDAA